MKSSHVVRVVAVSVVCALVGLPGSSALAATGITEGKFGSQQAFAVDRTPAFPSCSDASTYDEFTVTVLDAPIDAPFSEATGTSVSMGTNYLMIVPSGDPTFPWGLAMFNSNDEELRWNGTAWVTRPGAGWGSEKVFTEKGQLYGASSSGLLHNSTGGLGTFISPNSVLVGSRTYTPDPQFNVCTATQAIATNLGTLPVSSRPNPSGDEEDDDNVIPDDRNPGGPSIDLDWYWSRSQTQTLPDTR